MWAYSAFAIANLNPIINTTILLVRHKELRKVELNFLFHSINNVSYKFILAGFDSRFDVQETAGNVEDLDVKLE